MKVPLNWLRDYVDLDLPLPELCDRLTMVGLTVEAADGEGDDCVLTLEVTSNRADWLSVIGVAREVAALAEATLRVPKPQFAQGDEPTADSLAVEILAPDLGPRYTARLIRGVRVAPSPPWIQRRLEQVGVRPINNVVDATNYVCFEYGQPLHAFDAAKLGGGKIVVRRARAGEKMVTIDGEERQLTTEMLVIADAEVPVAVAGVMGGLASEVSEKTVDVLLESAHFNPVSVRRTAKALALRSEASHRFERWVDPNGAVVASDRATQLILETAGGVACRGLVDAYLSPVKPPCVEMDVERCRQVLGIGIDTGAIRDYLESLGLECEGEQRLRCTVPTFRNDIHQEADLVEEVARLHGYQNIPTTVPPNLSPRAGLSESRRLEHEVRRALQACGLNEIVTYSLTTPEEAQTMGGGGEDAMIALRNPLTSEATHLRTSLLPSALRCLELNSRRRVETVWGFELGKAYSLGGGSTPARELRRLSLALMGRRVTSAWNRAGDDTVADFYSLKGILEELLRFLGIPAHSCQPATHESLHPYRTAALLVEDTQVGVFGEVHPDLASRLGLLSRAYVAELDYEALVDRAVTQRAYAPLPRQPSADRDVAFVLSGDYSWQEAEVVIRQAAGGLLESVSLFDEYHGKQVGENARSLACSLRFRATDRTLEEGEADQCVESVKGALRDRLGAEIRE